MVGWQITTNRIKITTAEYVSFLLWKSLQRRGRPPKVVSECRRWTGHVAKNLIPRQHLRPEECTIPRTLSLALVATCANPKVRLPTIGRDEDGTRTRPVATIPRPMRSVPDLTCCATLAPGVWRKSTVGFLVTPRTAPASTMACSVAIGGGLSYALILILNLRNPSGDQAVPRHRRLCGLPCAV